MICDYFAAPDDAVASATIDWDGGPAHPPEGSSPLPTVAMPDLEPAVKMRRLESILTGRSYDEVAPCGAPLAMRGGGERLVFRLSDELSNGLARAADADIRDIAGTWSRTPEFWGRADLELLVAMLMSFSALIREALPRGNSIYCWLAA
jgi:hypothetical protein